MQVTYFALVPLSVGGETRQPGDLVPEARDWKTLRGYIADGKVAPLLVATLPKAARDGLAIWEREQEAFLSVVEAPVAEPADQTPEIEIENEIVDDSAEEVEPEIEEDVPESEIEAEAETEEATV